MRKGIKVAISLAVSVAILIVGIAVIWFNSQSAMTDFNPMETEYIELQDGSTGQIVKITDSNALRYLLNNFNVVMLKKDSVVGWRSGYNVRVTVKTETGSTAFLVDDGRHARRNGVLYKASENEYDVEFMKLMIENGGVYDPGYFELNKED